MLRRAGVDGTSRAQNLAANVDLCCVVCALTDGADPHVRRRALYPRRIERYLMTAENSRISALVLVNKADVVALDEAEAALFELSEGLLTARVLLVSAHTGQGLAQLSAELFPAISAVFVGSSGVGKSTHRQCAVGPPGGAHVAGA